MYVIFSVWSAIPTQPLKSLEKKAKNAQKHKELLPWAEWALKALSLKSDSKVTSL